MSQVDKSGKAVKINADGFPDIDSLDLEQDQTQLRYEAYKAVHQDRAKHASAETAAPRQSQQAQQHQPSSSRTPFADARPQSDDRYYSSSLRCHVLLTLGSRSGFAFPFSFVPGPLVRV